MSIYSEDIPARGKDRKDLLYKCIRALENLGWAITAVSDNTIYASTSKGWLSNSNKITLVCEDYRLIVASKTPPGSIGSVWNSPTKNVSKFIAEFEKVKYEIIDTEKAEQRVGELQTQTAHVAGMEMWQAAEAAIVKYSPERSNKGILTWSISLVVLLAIGFAFWYSLHGSTHRQRALSKETGKDKKPVDPNDSIYNVQFYQFMQMNAKAMALYNYRDSSYAQLKDTIQKMSIPYLDSAQFYLVAMSKLDVSANAHERTRLLKRYIEERKREMSIMLQMIELDQTAFLKEQLGRTRAEATELFETAINLPSH